MRTIRFALGLMVAWFTLGCTQSQAPRAGSDWVMSKPIHAPAPENTEGGPADASVDSWYSWYTNADRSIWMLDQPIVPKERMKIAWFRPARTKLDVSGRRLDAPAPPLFVETSPSGEEYRHRFQPSIMIFPTEGVWEIVAKAGDSNARFVIRVPGA
jgi:hypothetical protein